MTPFCKNNCNNAKYRLYTGAMFAMEFGLPTEKQYHCAHDFTYTYETWEDYPELAILAPAAAIWAKKLGFCSKCHETTTEHTNDPYFVQVYTKLSHQQKKEKKLKEMWDYL